MKKTITTLVVAGAIGSVALLAGAYSGLVNVGADDPHFPAVHAFLTMARDRSIEVRSKDIEVPNLDDEALIRTGAGNYNAMCIGCHLAPGLAKTELSQALYPAPPNLAEVGIDGSPAATFWVIKHGIKASGMPAWGSSMGDEYIWGMVAFLNQLPEMDSVQYKALVASSAGHQHGGGESQMHNHEGQHGDNKPGHHGDSAGAGAEHHGDAAAGHHAGSSTDSSAHAEEIGSSDAGNQPVEPSSPKTHIHADGHEHLHEG
ncbi:Cytochrome C oxidase, cbb3-type, subunit III [compost metagenome]